jgi:hypothetical protein
MDTSLARDAAVAFAGTVFPAAAAALVSGAFDCTTNSIRAIAMKRRPSTRPAIAAGRP